MKELMELFTRLVIAIEKIADPGCGSKCKCDEKPIEFKDAPHLGLNTKTFGTEIKDIQRDYDAIAAQKDGREVLLSLCEKRDIKVKKGTRDATLVKLLKESDKKTVYCDTSSGQVTVDLPKSDPETELVNDDTEEKIESGNLEGILSENVEQVDLPEIEETEDDVFNDDSDDDVWPSEEWID